LLLPLHKPIACPAALVLNSVVAKYEWRKDRKHRHYNYTIRNLLATTGNRFGPQAPSYKEFESRRKKRVSLVPIGYTSRLCKGDDFNIYGVFW
jgi:hypothetical protein